MLTVSNNFCYGSRSGGDAKCLVAHMPPTIYPITTSSEDQINTLPDWCSTSGLDDLDFFTTQTCSDTDSISIPFPDLLSANPPSLTASTTAGSPSQSPSTLPPPDDRSMAHSRKVDLTAPSLEIIPLPDHDDDLPGRLSDIQARLTKLVKSLSKGSKAAEDVEEIYRASEALIGILDGTSPSSSSSSHRHSTSLRPDGVAALLLSSCYLSLMKAYQFLVEMLQQELRNSTDPSAQGENLGGSVGNDPFASTRGAVPYLSIGAVRLAMPRKAIAEINLHLVSQQVQHLKVSMKQYASRVSAMQSSQATSLDAQRRESWDSIDLCAANDSTLTDLVESALVEIRVREERLLEKNLNTAPFSAQVGPNDVK